MIRVLIEEIDNFIEDCKEKEYEVYHEVYMSNGRFERHLFTKRQLLQYMKKHELQEINVFKIKDKVKINKTFELEE